MIRPFPSGGPHWLFGYLLRAKIGLFDKENSEYTIQQRINSFFKYVDFDYDILTIYSCILKKQQINPDQVKTFFKLNEYEYDKNEYNRIMNRICRM